MASFHLLWEPLLRVFLQDVPTREGLSVLWLYFCHLCWYEGPQSFVDKTGPTDFVSFFRNSTQSFKKINVQYSGCPRRHVGACKAQSQSTASGVAPQALSTLFCWTVSFAGLRLEIRPFELFGQQALGIHWSLLSSGVFTIVNDLTLLTFCFVKTWVLGSTSSPLPVEPSSGPTST